jgi:ribose transport system permease protein
MIKNDESSYTQGSGVVHFFRKAMKNQAFSMFLILIAMWIALAFMSPYFFTVSNIFEITLQTAVIAIIAAGESFIILEGGLDLSGGSVCACSAVLGGLVFQSTHSLALVLITTVIAGLGFGLANGLLITGLKVPPFIATLGMMGIARGLALIFSRGIPIFGLPSAYLWIGQGKLFNLIPVPTVIMLLVFIVSYLVLDFTRFGVLSMRSAATMSRQAFGYSCRQDYDRHLCHLWFALWHRVDDRGRPPGHHPARRRQWL